MTIARGMRWAMFAFVFGTASQLTAELVHQWKFNGYATDSIGSAHGTLAGGASLDDGRLFLDGIDGQVLTSSINETLTEKTLVAWVSLDDLDQPGGGSAISVQIGSGGSNGFDGIVYGERVARQWMAGSDFWNRSVPDNFGEEETVTDPGEVMMAISYAADSSITIYRDGQVYADPLDASQGTLNTYLGGDANVIFGRRHDGANNPLSGWVNEARIYSTALDLDEIQSVFAAGPDLTASDPPPAPNAPELRHQWTFNGDARDQIGSAHGALTGGAIIDGDRLVIDGVAGSRMLTAPIGEAIAAKTMVAWVSVDDVSNSTRGSALTLENNAAGDIFDAIVYGEALEQHWMAGSNGFARTQNPQEFGVEETVSAPGEVMVGIVYGTDNSVTLYRDGQEYGSYTKGALQPFGPDSVVQIGPRHGSHADVFAGFVNEARIYSGALSEEEMLTLFQEGPSMEPNPPAPVPPAPTMVHLWTFDGTADDQIGSAHGTLGNGASLTDDGRLSLEAAANQYFRSSPIDEDIVEKTLIAWVSLNDLDTPVAGSVLTLENPSGPDVFDGIVYGERVPGQWMAGSNNFARTIEDNGGSTESVTEPGEVMVAITYAADGTVTIYRDGEIYGEYVTETPPAYLADTADVLIGPRHEDRIAAGGPDHFFDGYVNEARIYNRALDADEIMAVFALGTSAEGDFDGNGAIAVNDIDLLSSHVRAGTGGGAFDLNDDGAVDQQDREVWVADIKQTYFGDANLDGEFNSTDFVAVFQAGEYEDAQDGNSTWATGDWDGDGDFGTPDFVLAFQQGGYEQGPRVAQAVPEPTSLLSILGGLAALLACARQMSRVV